MNIGANPVESHDLISEAEVTVCNTVLKSKETKSGKTIVDIDEDDITACNEMAAVESCIVTGSARKGSAVNVEHHRFQVGFRRV
jgi:hypothetical protein